MLKLLYIPIFIFLFSVNAIAQKTTTATMKISATIVSGITLNHGDAIDVSLDEGVQSQSNFEFIAPKHIDSDIEVKEKVLIENEFGDQIELISESEHYIEDGKHWVTLRTSVPHSDKKNMKGHYQGSLTTTINFL